MLYLGHYNHCLDTMPFTPVLIIGAGPAGLAVAGRLREKKISFELLEGSHRIANAWRQHYDRLCLHTVKELSHLPHLRFPAHYPRYVPRQLLVDYFDDYARQFKIQPHFGETVVSVEKKDGQWYTITGSGNEWISDYVVVVTGTNRIPHQPTLPGEESFKGKIIHSRQYKNPEPFTGQRVLVVGMGNTGAEVALDLSQKGVTTWLSVRGPINIVPRDVFGRPTQLTALMLAKLPFGLGDRLSLLVRRWKIGDLRPYGLELSPMSPMKYLVQTGKTPVIDIGALEAIKAGRIQVVPGIAEIGTETVQFTDGQNLPFEAIILCTGYSAQLHDFLPKNEDLLQPDGTPIQVWAKPPYEGLSFVGYDNKTPGGILGVIYRDSGVIVDRIAQLLKKAQTQV